MSGDKSYDSISDQKGANDLLKFLCRHLVALCVTYQHLNDEKLPIEEVQFFACPGIIISIRGICHFLTAGHTLQDWTTEAKKEKGSVLDKGQFKEKR